MSRPLISIITVIYNASSTLEYTLKSVLNQNKDLFEYWIIDGGSTDGSIDIIRKYEHQLAGWVSEPDKGIFDAMNKGIDRVNGDWLFFLGADDLLAEGVLSKVAPYLKPNLVVVYGNVQYTTGGLMRSYIGLRSLLENTLHHQGAFYHKKLFEGFRYNQKFNVAADYELTIRIYLYKQRYLYIPYVISIFAAGGNSTQYLQGGIRDLNLIRGLYLKNNFYNYLLTSLLNVYDPSMHIARKILHKLRKFLNVKKNSSGLQSNYNEM